MKFPYAMLRDYVETALDAEAVGDLLTMAGFELEGIETVDGDAVLDVKVVSNRGDGLSVFGLAREVLAKDRNAQATDLYKRAAARFPMPESENLAATQTSVQIETEHCHRYACRLFDGIPDTPTPEWVRRRLEQAGQRSLGLVVDLTNYVMLEIGQPLHAFDLDLLAERRIIVRQARDGERLVTLNGDEHELNPGMMMICDAERPVAAAGIMGGLATEVTEKTRRVLLESANFAGPSIRSTRRALGLSTEASYRFERSVDPELVVAALNRFAELLAEVDGGASRVPGVVDVYPTPPEPRSITLDVDRAARLLGMPVAPADAERYLTALGCRVQAEGVAFTVERPTWRPDLEREEDLVEELGRVQGYENIPETPIQGATTLGGVFGIYRFVDEVREAMVRLGYAQIISHTLRDQHPLDFHERWRVRVRNPHAPEIAYLRDSVLPSLSDAALRNGARHLHLFEIGRVFIRGEYQYDESPELGVLSIGQIEQEHWQGYDRAEADFYAMKGVIEQMAELVHTQLDVEPVREADRRFHPTRQAALVTTDDVLVGGFGVIHPDVAEATGLPAHTVMAELDLLAFYRGDHEPPPLRTIHRNPSVRRDISVQIDKAVPFARVEEAVRGACGDVLERFWLFDVYEGSGLPEGSHSLALALQLRKAGNFTDEEANQVRDAAVAALESLGAKLR